jgi:hypothetical protein
VLDYQFSYVFLFKPGGPARCIRRSRTRQPACALLITYCSPLLHWLASFHPLISLHFSLLQTEQGNQTKPGSPSLSIMHMRVSPQALQEDAIPFGVALGLSSTIILVLTVTRIWEYIQMRFGKWYILICLLHLAGSGGLVGILVSNIYERYYGLYLGLILVNSGLSGLYEVCIVSRMILFSTNICQLWSFRRICLECKEEVLDQICIRLLCIISGLITFGFVLWFVPISGR